MNEFCLYNNVKIPNIGFGTWHIKEKEILENSIVSAINLGYKHIDTASKYKNEELIGCTLKKYNIPREEIFLTSKVWNNDKGYKNTLEAFENTIKHLNTDYLDLYLIHWPMTSENWKEVNWDTWKALEKLYLDGKVRAIGVSNFLVPHLESLMKNAKIKPMVNQIEFHPGLMQIDTVEYCQEKNIVVEAWSPIGSGKMLNNIELNKIAKKYDKSVAQLCIKWCLQNNVLPLPKSTHYERIKENIDINNFNISSEDMYFINNMSYFAGSGLNPNIIF
jgi:diketogulonate reductase-like aldo/keto reductase